MRRIDKTIADVAYILDVLMAYRDITESGDCNTCKNEYCDWKPMPGQQVRYNCPHYNGKKGEAMDHGLKLYNDGTLEIVMPQGKEVTRVLVSETGAKKGDLYFKDADLQPISDEKLTLDEAIRHCEEIADYDCYTDKQRKCSEEHMQLANWLMELKTRRAKE